MQVYQLVELPDLPPPSMVLHIMPYVRRLRGRGNLGLTSVYLGIPENASQP